MSSCIQLALSICKKSVLHPFFKQIPISADNVICMEDLKDFPESSERQCCLEAFLHLRSRGWYISLLIQYWKAKFPLPKSAKRCILSDAIRVLLITLEALMAWDWVSEGLLFPSALSKCCVRAGVVSEVSNWLRVYPARRVPEALGGSDDERWPRCWCCLQEPHLQMGASSRGSCAIVKPLATIG